MAKKMAAPIKLGGKTAAMIVTKIPPVFIVGATGTGKSQLALELASAFNGEIISADSMQVYKRLDIVTNKVTSAERDAVPHHLIDYVNPHETSYTVWDFKRQALTIIDRLIEENKAPIIVGGTNYYIEALLWNMLIGKQEEVNYDSTAEKSVTKDGSTGSECDSRNEDDNKGREIWRNIPTLTLHQQLAEIDPVTARRLHPNNRRRIIRALEVYAQHGLTMSEILSAQHNQIGAGDISGPLRYPNSIVLWITCNQEVLDSRTDERVKGMVKQGLLQELTDFHEQYHIEHLQKCQEAPYTEGIFQSIGFKEFHDYLLLDKVERESSHGQKLLQRGIEDMKLVTRRYARSQKKWIVNRFLKRRGQNVPAVYALDSTCPETWRQDVLTPATDLISSILKGDVQPMNPLPTEANSNQPQHNVCDVCQLVFVTTMEWQAHLKGRRHKKAVERKHRQKKLEEVISQHNKEHEAPT